MGVLLEDVAKRYLSSLGFSSQLFDIEARLTPSSSGFDMIIDVGSEAVFRALFDLDSYILLSKASKLCPCNEIFISFKGSPKTPLRLQVNSLEMWEAKTSSCLDSYRLPEPTLVCSQFDTMSLPDELRWVAETAYICDSSLWVIDYDNTFRYYQPRKDGIAIQPLHSMIGRKLEEQEIPIALKQKTAWNLSLAIETGDVVVDKYVSPVTGLEIVTKVKPSSKDRMCFVFSMLRYPDHYCI